MKKSVLTGISFGLTSGTITTLGLMMGLYSGTHSKLIVIAGILTIAISDALSDALGIHISEESNRWNSKNIWTATIVTFLAKFLYALTFLVPIIIFNLGTAVIISIAYGFCVLGLLSVYIAKKNTLKVVLEHLGIATLVILIAYYVGYFIDLAFV